MRSFVSVPALLLLAVLLTGCAPFDQGGTSGSNVELTGDLSTPLQVEVDQYVRRQPPHVFVRPNFRATKQPVGLIVPFRMVQSMNQPTAFTDQVTRQFWSVWLSQGIFKNLEYEPAAGPYDARRALALARQRGAEVVIGGYIQHYIDGGDGGESTVTLQIEVHDVKSGVMLFSMAQGGLMERRDNNYYLVQKRQRLHGDPPAYIIRTLAWDMGREVHTWINPHAKLMNGGSRLPRRGSAF